MPGAATADNRWMRRYLTFLTTAIVASAVCFTATASANNRFATPDGDGGSQYCLVSDPCSLDDAFSGWANSGDVVILGAGDYTLTENLYVPDGVELTGAGADATTINSGEFAVGTGGSNAKMSDLRIDGAEDTSTFWMNGGELRRVFITNTEGNGCTIQNGYALMTDSVCASSKQGRTGLYMLTSAGTVQNVRLRNVTAVNTNPVAGRGIAFWTHGDGSTGTLDAMSVIASGVDSDVEIETGIQVTLDHSMYDTVDDTFGGTATAPGSGQNLTAQPQFNDPATFDLGINADSAAIGKGALDGYSGTTDVFGDARVQGDFTDIGAVERDVTPPDAPIITSPAPDAVLSSSPTFTGTSEPNAQIHIQYDLVYGIATSADETGAWSAGSGITEPGVHTLEVKAKDAAGNVGESTNLSFTLNAPPVIPDPPALIDPGPPAMPDSTPPELTFGKKPKSVVTTTKISLTFGSTEQGTTYKCKLDAGPYKPCKSPYKKSVKVGKHKLLIKAIDAAGNTSKITTIKWRVVKK
jgi:hypothetical protein